MPLQAVSAFAQLGTLRVGWLLTWQLPAPECPSSQSGACLTFSELASEGTQGHFQRILLVTVSHKSTPMQGEGARTPCLEVLMRRMSKRFF